MTQTRFIKTGSLIDGSGAGVYRNVFLAVKDSIITNIGPAADMPRIDAAMDDLSHCTVVPALVDCSVSLARSPAVDDRVRLAAEEGGPAQKAALAARHIRYCYSHGVLGVADNDESSGLKELLPGMMEPESSIDIRRAGADFLRIIYTGGMHNGDAADSSLNREALRRILQQRGEKKTVVAANGEQRVQEALEAGCDAIEQGYGMGEENLRKMAAGDVLWIPGVLMAKNGMLGSASGGDVMCRFSMRYVPPGKGDPGAAAFWEKMLAEQLAQLRLAKKLGVKTAVGTGAGSVGILHGESVVEEMKLFIKAGYSLEEAIRCASQYGAEFFGMKDLGALAVGRKATFLVARGGVQQLPRKLAYLENIYVDGAPRLPGHHR